MEARPKRLARSYDALFRRDDQGAPALSHPAPQEDLVAPYYVPEVADHRTASQKRALRRTVSCSGVWRATVDEDGQYSFAVAL
jgi:hypothetical protein